MKRMMKFGAMAITLMTIIGVMSGAVQAASTTVAGTVIYDKTSVVAGDYINLAILGLNSQGVVDTAGTNIFAEVKSLTGTITPGSTSVSSPSTGNFKAEDKQYIALSSGIGKGYITYATTSGNDLVTVTIQEKMSDGTYRTIASYSQSISVTPKTATTGQIAIYEVFGATGNATTTIGSGVAIGNNKVKVVAYAKGTTNTDTAASGTVTVSLRPTGVADAQGNVPTNSYSFSGTMSNGVAQVAVDGTSITKAGNYYVEAKFGDFSSVPLDPTKAWTVTVNPSSGVKYQVTPFNATIGTVSGGSVFGTGNGTTVRVTMLDSYGNVTTGSSTNAFTIAANDYVQFKTDYSTGKSVTAKIVNGLVDIPVSALSKGTAKIKAYGGDLSEASEEVSLPVVETRFETVTPAAGPLTATYTSVFLTGLQQKTVSGTTSSVSEGNTVTVTFIDSSKPKLKTVDYTATVQTANGNNAIAVTPEKAINATYTKISGLGYGEYTIQTPVTVNGGPAASIALKDAHNQSVTSLPVVNMTGTTYSTRVYYNGIKVTDTKGNAATDGGTGYSVTITTSNGTPASQALTTGTADVTYDSSVFSGADTTFKIALTNKSTVNTQPTVSVPSNALSKINAYLGTTSIPAGGVAPIRVETLNGSNSKINSSIVVDWTSTASEAQMFDAAGATSIGKGSVQSITGEKTFTFKAGTKSGEFNLTFKNSAGDIKAELKITVTSNVTPGKTVGADPGKQTVTVASNDLLNLVVNTTNSRNDTAVYTWFMFTGTASGQALPVYLLTTNNGIVHLTSSTPIYQNTYSYPSSSPAYIAQLKMSDLGLKSGDMFAYAYAYQNQVGAIVIDNVVVINIQ